MQWKPSRDHAAWRVRMLLLHAILLLSPVVLLFAQSEFDINSTGLCIFKWVFCVDCPACGVTHAAMSLFSGHFREAFHYNPGGPIVIGLIGGVVFYLSIILLGGYTGLEWAKEKKWFEITEQLGLGSLLIGWTMKLFIN
jgi:hypothetical protein